MEIQVQITVTQAGQTTTATVANFQRDTLTAETLGLTLAEAQQLLVNLQQIIAAEQVETYNQQQCACPDCGTSRARKDTKPLTYRTLFGKLELPSPRHYTCDCQPRKRKSESPLASLLPERSSPELLYLQTKWAALMSYGMTAELLTDVLPIEVGDASVRHQVLSVAQRVEDELGPEQVMFIDGSPSQWAELPEPDGRLFVGLDGGYIHAREGNNRKAGWFEAVVGKSVNAEGDGKSFGLVTTYDKKPKRRLYELLQPQGFQLNRILPFFPMGMRRYASSSNT